jgi:hypothetical protein
MLLKETKLRDLVIPPNGQRYVRCGYDHRSKTYMLVKESEYQGPTQYAAHQLAFLPGNTEVSVERQIDEIRKLKEENRLLKRLANLRDLEKRLKAHPGLTLHTNEDN